MDDEELSSEIFKNAKKLHGVPYLSRYGYIEEILEMESFLHALESKKLTQYVLSLYYDSKACFCHVETREDADDSSVQRLISDVASSCISQFHLFGVIGHRDLGERN